MSLIERILEAISKGTLKQPFTWQDLKRACPGYADKTYRLILVHHRKGNPIGYPEYFKRIDQEHFGLVRKTPIHK